ncbi:Mss4-like protein [Coniella lustricola]|uniref:Mss4-like protein n=1 Tax=Coniella lustricola TaxID=2025994 RepID=A0A2T2ZW02_9PEZI|nr:Mss4-like protein [Coniella lustricola]
MHKESGKHEVARGWGSVFCTCKTLQYTVKLDSADSARTSLCHCSSCKKAFIPLESFQYTNGEPKLSKQDNGVVREFCPNCGSLTCEYGEQAADKFRYSTCGTLDDPEKLPPKGEFFCKEKSSWMPEIPDIFHKQKIQE